MQPLFSNQNQIKFICSNLHEQWQVHKLYIEQGSNAQQVTLAKAKTYKTCIAPQAAYRSCSGAVYVTDSWRTAYKAAR